MKIYCIESFKNAFEKLSKKNSHKSIESETIEYFFNKEINQLLSGTRLNNSQTEPYIKKRLDGRGGYRIYFLIVIKGEALYLMFVHPKTGPDGAENIDDNYKAKIYKEVLECIKTENLFELSLNNDRIQFKHILDK